MTSSSHELNEVLRTLVERIGQMMRLREAVIFLYEEALEAFAVQATYGFKRHDALQGRTLKLGEGISGSVGLTREPLMIDDLTKMDGYLGFWGEAERGGSLAAVPILYREKLLGVLTVTRPEHDRLTEVHLKLLCAIADNAALALRNAQLFERMRGLSTHDELTGLANHRLLRNHLDREIDRARRFEKSFSVLMVELDHYAQLHEQHGPLRADAALRDVAQLLQTNVRKIDTVARTGAEQFMLLLPRSELRDALMIAEKLRKAVYVHPFFEAAEQPPNKLTVSIGVAQLTPADDDHGDSLMLRANQGLLLAKQSGRNRVCSGEPSPPVERSLM